MVKSFCLSPCKACDTINTKCLSCLPSPNTLIYYNPVLFQCLSVCPDGTYSDANKICQNCLFPCANCTSNNTCTSCAVNRWLYLTTCIDPCPDKFYKGTGVCENCVGLCDLCLDATRCLSCKSNFYSNFSCVNETSCPTGTYGNTTTLTC